MVNPKQQKLPKINKQPIKKLIFVHTLVFVGAPHWNWNQSFTFCSCCTVEHHRRISILGSTRVSKAGASCSSECRPVTFLETDKYKLGDPNVAICLGIWLFFNASSVNKRYPVTHSIRIIHGKDDVFLWTFPTTAFKVHSMIRDLNFFHTHLRKTKKLWLLWQWLGT